MRSAQPCVRPTRLRWLGRRRENRPPWQQVAKDPCPARQVGDAHVGLLTLVALFVCEKVETRAKH